MPKFDDLPDLKRTILAFSDGWNQEAARFNWTQKSFEREKSGQVDAALKAP